MGKIKEAFMIQEEIKEQLKEKHGFTSESTFSILDFCSSRNIMPLEAEEVIMKMNKKEAEKIWSSPGTQIMMEF
jgi:hypothetical protein